MGNLYFAYGSNMDEEHLREHCSTSRYLDCGRLDGHRLAFTRRSIVSGTGVADVVVAPTSVVWGVVYDLGDGDLEALDRKEGNGWAYQRERKRIALAADGSIREANVYTVLEKERHEVPPAPEYIRRLLAAAERRGLPAEYIATLRAIPFVS